MPLYKSVQTVVRYRQATMYNGSNIRLVFSVQISKEKNAASTNNVFFWICIFICGYPHHLVLYIWSPLSKSILFAMLFVWCRPGYMYVRPYLADVSSFKPSPVASFHVLAKPVSGFSQTNGMVNHRLESP